MEDTGESPTVDSRLDFICNYVLKTLKLKQDKWEKLLSSEDNRQILQEFLDGVETRTLVLCVTAAGLLQPSPAFTASRNKAVYFLKRSGAALTPDSMKERLVYGELCSAVLDQFSAVVQEVRGRGEGFAGVNLDVGLDCLVPKRKRKLQNKECRKVQVT